MIDKQTKDIESNEKLESATENTVEVKSLLQRLLCTKQWLRLLFMLFFAVVLCVSGYLISLLVLLQFIFALVTGQNNEKLRQLGSSFSMFIFQILQFITYNSEEKPFPFADWPDTGVKSNDASKKS
jgi:Domain of unknown function (DUF4389)